MVPPHRTHTALALVASCFYGMTVAVVRGRPDEGDLRTLLLHERNQELLDQMGTRYEVVYPHQIRKDWGSRGLSTRLASVNGTMTHVQETTLLMETRDYKLQLDLQLNSKLFAPSLVQLLYLRDDSPVTAQKLPENCYYHAKVRNYPKAKAAFQTCNGIRGMLYLGEKIFFIHPLHGSTHSAKAAHLLYHFSPEDELVCGTRAFLQTDPSENSVHSESEEWSRNKYIEMALVLDQTLFEMHKSPPSEVLSSAIEIVNYVDLLYRPLNTHVSLVYLELWLEDPMHLDTSNASASLLQFREYAAQKISRILVDATHMLTGMEFDGAESGVAFLDSICTNDAVGITRVSNILQPHVTSFVLAHMLGHNLGMSHDDPIDCACPEVGGCVMEDGTPILTSTTFSSCSVRNYERTLAKGYGACLYNMPTMRMSICGNSILEEPEQCDCGTTEECAKSNPCCDPSTCRLIKHAQCSSGPCCRKCLLLSPDYLCRPSKGECDIPEFCDGAQGECPGDIFKRNGAVCSGGHGYCYQGECPVTKHQCQDIWGEEADAADSICFERLNVQGTPNGNCGTDGRGEISKCDLKNSYCGYLQCSQGSKTPLSLDKPPVHFVVHKINSLGTVHECKARTFSTQDLREGLVKEGTKCGFQKVCINQTCTSLKTLPSGQCPTEGAARESCSGHGVCTNVNSCFCDEGWKGADCSQLDEEANWKDDYDPSGSVSEVPFYGQNEMKLNPNLALTVIAASVVIGVGLVILVALIFFFRYT